MKSVFANHQSVHSYGVSAYRILLKAKDSIAQYLGVHSDEIIITSGASESNMLFVRGMLENAFKKGEIKKRNTIIISKIEHSSMGSIDEISCVYGACVRRVNVAQDGTIDLEHFATLIDDSVLFVSIMYVNSEIGTVMQLEQIAKIIRAYKKKSYQKTYPIFHTDATQCSWYIRPYIPKIHVDALTLDSLKMFAPHGVGVLYKKRGLELSSMNFGSQEKNMWRTGTLPIYAVAGLGCACRYSLLEGESITQKVSKLRNETIAILEKEFGKNIRVNGSTTDRVAHNLSVTFFDANHDYILQYCSYNNIFVSTASACLDGGGEVSSVLLHTTQSNKREDQRAIRISFGPHTTKRDVKMLVKCLKKAYIVDTNKHTL